MIAARTPGQPGAPLFLTFHGTGGTEQQFHGLAHNLLPQAHITSPRGDVSEGGALRYFRRTSEGVYDMADLAARTAAMVNFIAAEQASTGAKRTIGLGYSNGANIAAAVSFAHPDAFTDLILLHPLIPFAPAPQPGLSGKRILITAGQRDPICPAPLTQKLADTYQSQGADVTLHWHPGGHEIASSEGDALTSFLAASGR
jgi:phospholipase/carboxylesterase